jgi:transglutaminase-like putative cysteine protease
MNRLTIHHVTTYRYRNPVRFGEHRLMFRPRDSHDLRLIHTELAISPAASVRWYHDVFGNSITIASFTEAAAELRFESTIELEHYGVETTEFPIAEFAQHLPFTYSPDELPDLTRTTERHYSDPDRKIDTWARRFLNPNGHSLTQDVLVAMTQAIRDEFTYQLRELHGVQTPTETLVLGSGSCRDYAVFLMEAARSLGLAARFVTGYLYDPALDGAAPSGLRGAGNTHAWAQIYLPGAGWVEFDPTNGMIGGANLFRVGVARTPEQAVPLQGTFHGQPDDLLDMTVNVTVTAMQRPLSQAV